MSSSTHTVSTQMWPQALDIFDNSNSNLPLREELKKSEKSNIVQKGTLYKTIFLEGIN